MPPCKLREELEDPDVFILFKDAYPLLRLTTILCMYVSTCTKLDAKSPCQWSTAFTTETLHLGPGTTSQVACLLHKFPLL